MGQRDKGKLIAKKLWSELETTPDGSSDDRNGIDARLNGLKYQIKYDGRIYRSNNIWHEIYEKTHKRPDQPWRKSPANVEVFLFITESPDSFIGYEIKLDSLARVEKGEKLRTIIPNMGDETSMGVFIAN